MCDPFLNQILSFKSSLVWPHVDARVHLEEVNLLQSNVTTDIAGANVQVGETATYQFIFVVFILDCWESLVLAFLVLMDQVDVILDLLYVCRWLHSCSIDDWLSILLFVDHL